MHTSDALAAIGLLLLGTAFEHPGWIVLVFCMWVVYDALAPYDPRSKYFRGRRK